MGISATTATTVGIIGGNVIIGGASSAAVDTIASEEIVEKDEIIANALVNGTISGIFSFAGLKITDLLGNSLRGIKAGMKWDAFYAGKGMNGSSLNSREYHQMMYILKRMGTEVVERSVK